MCLVQNLLKEEARNQTLQSTAKPILRDPLGLVTSVKQKGAILVRRAFQEARVKYCLEDTWDAPLSEGLQEDALKLLEEHSDLSQLCFTRALTPLDPSAEPIAITFSNGSEHAYGTVMYLCWSCRHGAVMRLVEYKAKRTPLNQKGRDVCCLLHSPPEDLLTETLSNPGQEMVPSC